MLTPNQIHPIMQLSSYLYSLIIFATTVLTHGIIISPPPRAPGPASLSACGKEITSILKSNNQTGIEALRIAAATAKDYHAASCNLLMCKGLQLTDNKHNVQQWLPGQKVTLQVWTRIPHIGWWSVGVIDTKTSLLIGGTALKTGETTSVSGYGLEEMVEHEDKTDEVAEKMMVDFEIEISVPKAYPRCAVAGDCVLQWTWFGRVVKQTYESCIDFVIVPESYSAGGAGNENIKSQMVLED